MIRKLLFNSFLLLSIFTQAQQDFQLSGNGGQADLGNDCFRLTQAANTQFGNVWYRRKADLSLDFDLTANLNFGTNNGNGADGIVFAFQNQCTNAGGGGGGIGIQGVTPSIFVEFDTYQNTEFGDPTNDHIAILKNGGVGHGTGNSLVAPVCATSSCANIESGADFPVRILWTASTQTLQVFFNGELRTTYSGNIVADIFGGSPYVYWGFTSATGGFNNQHTVCITEFNNNIVQLNDASICAGQSYQANLPGGINYTWTPTTNISNPNSSSPVLSPTETTTYIVSISDACNNIQTDSITITVNPLPVVNFNFTPSSPLCTGASAITLTGASPAGGTFTGTAITGSSFNPSTAGAGNFDITYTFTDNNGCTNSDVSTLSVFTAPNVSLTGLGPFCNNSPSVNLVGGLPAGGIYSGSGVSGSTFNPANANTGNNTINYSVTTTDGCSGSASTNIVINPAPLASILTPNGTVLCGGNSVVISVNNQSGVSYEWLRNGVVVSALATNNTNYSVTQTGNYSVRAVGIAGCESLSSSVTITSGQTPTASITSDATNFCPGELVTFSSSVSGAGSIQWLLNENPISNATNATYSASSAGSYSLRATSNDGCITTSNAITITLNPGVEAVISSSLNAFCPPSLSIELQSTTSNGATYNWLLNGNQVANANSSSLNATQIGDYQVVVTLGSCVYTSSVVTLINGAVPEISISSASTELCEGSELLMESSGGEISFYNWLKDGVSIGINSPVYSATTSGAYSLEVTGLDGCLGISNTINITEIPGPISSITSTGTVFCPGGSDIVITAQTVDGATYEWYRNNVSLGSPSNANTWNVSESGNYLVVVNNGTCSSASNTITITQSSLPNSAGTIFGGSDFCPGEILDLFVFGSNNATSYNWTITPNTAASIYSGQGTDEVTIVTLAQNFTLSITPINGCGNGPASSEALVVDNSVFCNSLDAAFSAYPTNVCTGNTVTFYNFSDTDFFFGGTANWNFGAGASPATATGNGPFNVTYSTAGLKNVTLEYIDQFGFTMGGVSIEEFIIVSGSVATPVISGATDLTACNGVTEAYSVNATAGSTYNWTVPSLATIFGQGTSTVQVTFNGNAGNVQVVETTAAGCSSAPGTLLVECPLSTEELVSNTLSWNIFPNPAFDFVQIAVEGLHQQDISIELLDLTGRELYKKILKVNSNAHQETISLNPFPSGMYLLRLSANGKLHTKRLVH